MAKKSLSPLLPGTLTIYSSMRSSRGCAGLRGYAGGFAAIEVMEDNDRASTGVEGEAKSAMKDQTLEVRSQSSNRPSRWALQST